MKRNYNLFLLFCCSLVPGVGYMYLGLMQRGVEAMILFIAGIVVPAWLQMPALAVIIAVPLWFYCFFDSFYQRANLEAGLEVEDQGMVNLLRWLTANYYLLGLGLIGLGGLALLNTLGQDLAYSGNLIVRQISFNLQRYLPPLLLIAAGFYLLRRTRGQVDNISENNSSAPINTAQPMSSTVSITGGVEPQLQDQTPNDDLPERDT